MRTYVVKNVNLPVLVPVNDQWNFPELECLEIPVIRYLRLMRNSMPLGAVENLLQLSTIYVLSDKDILWNLIKSGRPANVIHFAKIAIYIQNHFDPPLRRSAYRDGRLHFLVLANLLLGINLTYN